MKRRGDREADQSERRENIGIGNDQRVFPRGKPVPKSRARVIGRRLVRPRELLLVRVEEDIVVDRCRSFGRLDPAIGVFDPFRRRGLPWISTVGSIRRACRKDPSAIPAYTLTIFSLCSSMLRKYFSDRLSE